MLDWDAWWQWWLCISTLRVKKNAFISDCYIGTVINMYRQWNKQKQRQSLLAGHQCEVCHCCEVQQRFLQVARWWPLFQVWCHTFGTYISYIKMTKRISFLQICLLFTCWIEQANFCYYLGRWAKTWKKYVFVISYLIEQVHVKLRLLWKAGIKDFR